MLCQRLWSDINQVPGPGRGKDFLTSLTNTFIGSVTGEPTVHGVTASHMHVIYTRATAIISPQNPKIYS